MSYSVLIIGYGSIGKRHASLLTKMDNISNVSILSSQSSLPYDTISSLEEISKINPDYIVIASPTNKHYEQLNFLENHLKNKKILVEKPLFDSMIDFKASNNKIYVGYNLRFHPMFDKIKEICNHRKIWNIHAICCSYLPDWRSNMDYRKSYSSHKKFGGGVLLDLSHELDYAQWLTGSMIIKHVISDKISNLEINSDDLLLFVGRAENGAYVNIILNYFTRKSIREVIIDGEGISLQGDFLSNTLSGVIDDKSFDYTWEKFDINETYLSQHDAVLNGDLKYLCTFEEGLETMRLIDSIRNWPN